MVARALNIADLRRLAQRRLPRGIFEYVDRGAEDEQAMAGNTAALQHLRLRPRVLRDVSARSSRTQLFGRPLALPLVLAPTGVAGLLWHRGEIALARAAASVDLPFTLSTGSLNSVEEVAQAVGPKARLWFQLNIWCDRALSWALLDRARDAGCEVLVVTVDSVLPGNREYNQRNGFGLPFKPTPRNALDAARHPRWLIRVIGRYLREGGMPQFQNYPAALRVPANRDPSVTLALRNDSLTWEDIAEIRRRWPGPLVIKGILHPEDAALAETHGADGIVVSNHGGRNLDAAMAPLDALPAIADRLGGRLTLLMDGGVRRGTDIARALALGADGVLAGRAPLYGLAAGGEAGAARALALLGAEFDRTLAFLGCISPEDIDADLIAPGAAAGIDTCHRNTSDQWSASQEKLP